MYLIKHAFQAIDHGVPDVTVLYMDVRAYGKGFDSFWKRTEEGGAKFVRPAVAHCPGRQRTDRRFEDTSERRIKEQDVDMVVLATAVQAPRGLQELGAVLGLETAEDGFLRSEETGFGLASAAPGPASIWRGAPGGPKDIPDTVAEASGAAAAALSHLDERSWPVIEVAGPTTTSRIHASAC